MSTVVTVMAYLQGTIAEALQRIFGLEVSPQDITFTIAPAHVQANLALSCHQLAVQQEIAPAEFAAQLVQGLATDGYILSASTAGPFVNLTLNPDDTVAAAIEYVGSSSFLADCHTKLPWQTVMVEYLSPNTNKPLHLGHLRNGVLGNSVANILRTAGVQVIMANNINDRGIHIVQSMIAYLMFGEGETPNSTGIKGDHFVGRWYVEFSKLLKDEYRAWIESNPLPCGADDVAKEKHEKEFREQSELYAKAREMLIKWEAGDPEVRELWQRMNDWVYAGFDETNRRVGFCFDRVYYESKTYMLGRDVVLGQLESGVGFRDKDGSVRMDLTDYINPTTGKPEDLKKKVLLRQDGTAVYTTQDIGLAVTRFEQEAKLDGIVYVVAREQDAHFKALFEIMRRYGYHWSGKLFHLSYGMVNLPSGRMKSREGTVVDADDLLDSLREMAKGVIAGSKEKARGDNLDDLDDRAEKIALAALKFFLVLVNPNKDMIFDPGASLSFEGKTGPYIQYAYARLCAIERACIGLPASIDEPPIGKEGLALSLNLMMFPPAIRQAATQKNPAIVARALFEAAQASALFYGAERVVNDGTYHQQRLALCEATQKVLGLGLQLLGIPVLERM